MSIFWGLPFLGAQPIARNLRFAVGSLLSHIPEGEKKRFHLPRCPVLVMRILELLSDDMLIPRMKEIFRMSRWADWTYGS